MRNAGTARDLKRFTNHTTFYYEFLRQEHDPQARAFLDTCEGLSFDDNTESNFALPQILMALSKCKNPPIRLVKQIHKSYSKVEAYNLNDIFRYNWHVQLFVTYSLRIPKNLETNLLSLVESILSQHLETNYYAVAWEALTYLRKTRSRNRLLFHLLYLLCNRLTDRKLLAFKDGSVRIDITSHFINGFSVLL